MLKFKIKFRLQRVKLTRVSRYRKPLTPSIPNFSTFDFVAWKNELLLSVDLSRWGMFAGLKGCYMNQGKRSDKRMTKAEQ
jgi:hypothetical protein